MNRRWVSAATLPWVLAGLLLYAPILVTIVYSFNSASRGWRWETFSTRWYLDTWSDPALRAALGSTAIVVILATALSAVLGLAVAYRLAFVSRRSQNVFLFVLLLPILVPDLLLALSHSALFDALRVPRILATVALSQSLVGTAYVALFITIALRSIDFPVFERAARSLGADTMDVARHHYLPLARNAALVGSGFVALYSAQDFLFAFFVGGTGTTTLAVRLQSQLRFAPSTSINVVYTLTVVASLMLATLLGRSDSHRR